MGKSLVSIKKILSKKNIISYTSSLLQIPRPNQRTITTTPTTKINLDTENKKNIYSSKKIRTIHNIPRNDFMFKSKKSIKSIMSKSHIDSGVVFEDHN